MGKFDGVLFLSDFDNTLLFTAEIMQNGGVCPTMPQRNLDAIHFFMAEGGRFGVATGRATDAFRPYAPMVPTNTPAIVNNGGSIYDYARNEYIESLLLDERARPHITAAMAANPAVSVELFYPDGQLKVYHETLYNQRHAQLTGMSYEVIHDFSPQSVKMPLSKVLFLGEEPLLQKTAAFLKAQDWQDQYELIFSSETFLEMTAIGATKGGMARRLMARLGCQTLVCAGDHMNDLSMLTTADVAFCPANAVPEVRKHALAVCHCRDGAIADMIAHLDRTM